ncbi:MAG: DevR family CRISPR-associated autoregulator [bacterium]
MIKFITFAVKTQLNVHDLNNEAVAGNVTDIRIMEFLDEEGKRVEAPAVSGRMLKHWHLEGMRKLGLEKQLAFCDSCKIGEPVRPAKLTNNGILSHREAIGEGATKVVEKCVICDVHGYLAAIAGGGSRRTATSKTEEEQEAVSERRSSRVMFSWLVPVLEKINPESDMGPISKQVIHSRVKSGKDFDDKKLVSQMPFNKSYASGIYAFVSALDVDRIGLVELNLGSSNPYAVDDNNGRKERIKVSIEAYRLMLSGQIGASLSHAIPHQNPIEILVAYSETGPLPFPVSPMYSDWLSKTIGLMPQGTQFLYWGPASPQNVTKKNTINEIFDELLSKV